MAPPSYDRPIINPTLIESRSDVIISPEIIDRMCPTTAHQLKALHLFVQGFCASFVFVYFL